MTEKVRGKSANHVKRLTVEEMMKLDGNWKKLHSKTYITHLEGFIFQLLDIIGDKSFVLRREKKNED